MLYLRMNWPSLNISPKLHMLEDHVVEFLRHWKVGFGFYGEQGGESIHHDIKRMQSRYDCIKSPLDRLRYLMKQHLLTTNPQAQEIKPEKKEEE